LGLTGVANGLALAGQRPIVEFMFGDFSFLAFDQIANFAAKSVSMYGSPLPFHLLARIPVGGHRGYGATHSQSLQKHFIGIPGLSLFEISPLHDNCVQLPHLLALGNPAMLFESKTLYGQPQLGAGPLDDLFTCDFLDPEQQWARVRIDESPAVTLIATGGMFPFCWRAARELFLEWEIEAEIIAPFALYPFDPTCALPTLSPKRPIVVVEESTAGGTWGAEVLATLSRRLGKACPPINLLHSADSIIPAARHLESQVLVQTEDIIHGVRTALEHASDHRTDH
jgi:pyruvate dehydrogenase E1 component beta subunit